MSEPFHEKYIITKRSEPMTNTCAFCNNSLQSKEEINIKIYGKPCCNSKECLAKANVEMQVATDAAMSPKGKVISYFARENFKEQKMAKGLFIQDSSNIAVDLRELPPKIGVLIGGEVREEGHGILRVVDVRNTIETMLKSKPRVKEKAKEQPAPKPPLGKIIKLHQMAEGTFVCVHCSKPFNEWKPMEECTGVVKEEPKAQPKQVEVVENPKGDEKVKEEEKGVVPQEKAKAPAKLSDHELEEKIERAKARRFTSGQGDFYKVSGKERPDAAMIQKLANESGISVEITKAEQTDKYAHVEVVGIFGNLRVPAVVHHDFDTEFMLKTMEIIAKNPKILDHYEGTNPVIKEGATIKQGDDVVDAKYYLVHTLLSFKKFSLRDACTKAMSIVELKLLNQEFRDEEEIASEQGERELIEKKKK